MGVHRPRIQSTAVSVYGAYLDDKRSLELGNRALSALCCAIDTPEAEGF